MKKCLSVSDIPTAIYSSSGSNACGSVRVLENPHQIYNSFNLDTDDDYSDYETLTPFQKNIEAFIHRYSEHRHSPKNDLEKSQDFISLLLKTVRRKTVSNLFWIPMGTSTPTTEEESDFCMKAYDLSTLVKDYCPIEPYKIVAFLLLEHSLEGIYFIKAAYDFASKASSLHTKLEDPPDIRHLISTIISKCDITPENQPALVDSLIALYPPIPS